eukprot:scaffold7052_cov254-Pinguiococcus_pyrenoidosus.AAC.28
MRWLCYLGLLMGVAGASATADCETLHSKLVYEQKDAPSDISAVIAIVTQKVNEELEGKLSSIIAVLVRCLGVVGVTVKYLGDDIHRKVGEHDVVAEVQQEKKGEQGTPIGARAFAGPC